MKTESRPAGDGNNRRLDQINSVEDLWGRPLQKGEGAKGVGGKTFNDMEET